MEILAYMAIFFLFVLMYLDFLRYQDGKMESSYIIFLLFLNHLAFAYHFIPLLVLRLYRKQKIKLNQSSIDRLINTSFAVISVTLLIMAILSYVDRYSLIMYAVYVLVANFMFLIGHRLRLLFNVISYLMIAITIFSVPGLDYTTKINLIIEAGGITLPAVIIANFRYNDQVSQFMHEKELEEVNKKIEREQEKNEELLLNLLPKNIAEELKLNGFVLPKNYPDVSIMFTDFVNFSNKSEKVTPEDMVQRLDFYFSTFDQIIEQYKLEKIKTLGDGYMCIGGIGSPTEQACINMVSAAIAIRDFVQKESEKCQKTNQLYFDIRIGVHIGSVIAGVLGKKKLSFDIWSHNVNIASRMENNSEIGAINISEPVYNKIKDHFKCTYRGEIPVKGLGMMAQYFVES